MTRDEDLFSDNTDIFADVTGRHSVQASASSSQTTDSRRQPPNDDNEGDCEFCC